jgi:hypothetical protein
MIMFGSFLPSLWSSTNHSLLGSKEPTLLCNQVDLPAARGTVFSNGFVRRGGQWLPVFERLGAEARFCSGFRGTHRRTCPFGEAACIELVPADLQAPRIGGWA